jgi:hypothetical protein
MTILMALLNSMSLYAAGNFYQAEFTLRTRDVYTQVDKTNFVLVASSIAGKSSFYKNELLQFKDREIKSQKINDGIHKKISITAKNSVAVYSENIGKQQLKATVRIEPDGAAKSFRLYWGDLKFFAEHKMQPFIEELKSKLIPEGMSAELGTRIQPYDATCVPAEVNPDYVECETLIVSVISLRIL